MKVFYRQALRGWLFGGTELKFVVCFKANPTTIYFILISASRQAEQSMPGLSGGQKNGNCRFIADFFMKQKAMEPKELHDPPGKCCELR